MGMMLRLLTAFVLSIVALALSQSVPDTTTREGTPLIPTSQVQSVIVERVIDGDTIVLSDGNTVRYIGIDTPEVHPKVECFGVEATAYNTELVLGKSVLLFKDVSETDKYNRLLRYVYLEDGTFVNEALVQAGYAHARSYPPDIAQQNTLRDAEREAREHTQGLWNTCKN